MILGNYAIDHAVSALEEAIENKKIQMQSTQVQPGTSVAVSYLYSEILNRANDYYAQMTKALGYGKEFAQGFLNKALQHMQEEPWEFVRKVAVYSFATGLFLSRRHRKPPTEV